MTAGKGAAPRKRGGSTAAKAEKNGKVEMDFEGLKVTLPPKLPGSFSYRFAKIARLEETQQLPSGELYALVVGIIGEDQYEAVCDQVDETGSELTLVDFLIHTIEAYGSEPGKSPASASS